MLISGTEHEVIEQEIQELKSKVETLDITSEVVGEVEDITTKRIKEIFELLPNVAKKLKSMPKTIQDSIPKYGFNSVRMAAIYLSKQKNLKSPRAYFLKSLEQKWYKDVAEVIQKPKNIVLEPSNTVPENRFDPSNVESQKSSYSENVFNEFQKLDEKVRDGIESYAYREYISRCGAETKVQKLAFLAGRKSIITDFLIKYPRILSEEESSHEIEILDIQKDVEDKNIEEACLVQEMKKNEELIQPELPKEEKTNEISGENELRDIHHFNEIINETIEIYKVVLQLSDEKILEIKKELLNSLVEKFLKKTLTIEIIKKAVHEKAVNI